MFYGLASSATLRYLVFDQRHNHICANTKTSRTTIAFQTSTTASLHQPRSMPGHRTSTLQICSHYELGDAVARAAICTKQSTFVHLLVPSSCRRNRLTDHWPETLVPQSVPLTNELRSKFPVDAWLLKYDQNLHGIRVARSREHLNLSVRC